jgi:glycogen debranching enzyme
MRLTVYVYQCSQALLTSGWPFESMACSKTEQPPNTALMTEGYARALDLLHACRRPEGFLASTENKSNYQRVWGRDGAITSIASMRSGIPELIETAKSTLRTLARHQGPHGEIPSNVDPENGRVSYGGTAGRVDADLWFIIAAAEIGYATEDETFLAELWPVLERVRFLLGCCWEFNNRGLLYLQAQRSLRWIDATLHARTDEALPRRIDRLTALIRANYWIENPEEIPQAAYHPVIYRKSRDAEKSRASRYWLPFFSPHGYGYRFDAFANVLTTLVGVASEHEERTLDAYLDEIVDQKLPLIPAFAPVITPHDGDWAELQITFSHSFKNQPYEYQNGGLWPMIAGFSVARLAELGHLERARTVLESVHRANHTEWGDEEWGFPEYLNGRTLEPGGTRNLAWSAAGAIIGHHAIEGDPPFTRALRECD